MTHQELMDKYPKIMGECYPSVGSGWLPALDKLCSFLQFNTDRNNYNGRYPQVVAVQIKEKFGGLRFYVDSATDEQSAAIEFAEYIIGGMCEVCGESGERINKGWIRTLCGKHSEKCE